MFFLKQKKNNFKETKQTRDIINKGGFYEPNVN